MYTLRERNRIKQELMNSITQLNDTIQKQVELINATKTDQTESPEKRMNKVSELHLHGMILNAKREALHDFYISMK